MEGQVHQKEESAKDNTVRRSRWADASQNLDSPIFEPVSKANHKIPSFSLNPPNKPGSQNPSGPQYGGRTLDNERGFHNHYDVQVSHIDHGITKNMISHFFKANPINIDMKSSHTAIVSFRSMEDAQSALSMNGKMPLNCNRQTQRLNVTPTWNSSPLISTPRAAPFSPHMPRDHNPRILGSHDGVFDNFHQGITKKPNGPDFVHGRPHSKDAHKFKSYPKPTHLEAQNSKTAELEKRPSLNLAKRTKPIDTSDIPPRNSAIFGQANPINDPVSIGADPAPKDDDGHSNTIHQDNKILNENSTTIQPIQEINVTSIQENKEHSSVSNSPSSIKPSRTYLGKGGDSIKKLINADHNTTSTHIKKSKENPYGGATPIKIKEKLGSQQIESDMQQNELNNDNSLMSKPDHQEVSNSDINNIEATSKRDPPENSEKTDTGDLASKSQIDSESQPSTQPSIDPPILRTSEEDNNVTTASIISKSPDSSRIITRNSPQLKDDKTSTLDSPGEKKNEIPKLRKDFSNSKLPVNRSSANFWFSDKQFDRYPSQEIRGTDSELKNNNEWDSLGSKEKSDFSRRNISPSSNSKMRNMNRKNREPNKRPDLYASSPNSPNSQHLQNSNNDKPLPISDHSPKGTFSRQNSDRTKSDQKRSNFFSYDYENSSPILGMKNRGQRNETPPRVNEIRPSYADSSRNSNSTLGAKKPNSRTQLDNSDGNNKTRTRRYDRSSEKPSKSKFTFSNSPSTNLNNSHASLNTIRNSSNNEPSEVITQNRYSLLNTD